MQTQKLLILVTGFAVWGALLHGMDAVPVAAAELAVGDAAVVEGPVAQRQVPALLVLEIGPDGALRRVADIKYLNPDALLQMLLADLAQQNSWEAVGQLFTHGLITTARGTLMLVVLAAPYVAAAGKQAFVVGRSAAAALAPYVQPVFAACGVQAKRGWNAAGRRLGRVASRAPQRVAAAAA